MAGHAKMLHVQRPILVIQMMKMGARSAATLAWLALYFSTPKEQVDIVTRGLFAFHFRALLRRISLFTPLLIGLQVAVVAVPTVFRSRNLPAFGTPEFIGRVSSVPWDSRFSLQFPLAFIAMNMRRLVVSGLAPATDRRLCNHRQKDLFAAVLARRIKAIPIAGRFYKKGFVEELLALRADFHLLRLSTVSQVSQLFYFGFNVELSAFIPSQTCPVPPASSRDRSTVGHRWSPARRPPSKARIPCTSRSPFPVRPVASAAWR